MKAKAQAIFLLLMLVLLAGFAGALAGPSLQASNYWGNEVVFLNTVMTLDSNTEVFSARFTAVGNKDLKSVSVWVNGPGSPKPTFNVGIQDDNGEGYPSKAWLIRQTYLYVAGTYLANVVFDNVLTLVDGNVYHLVMDRNSGDINSTNYLQWRRSTSWNKIHPRGNLVDANLNVMWSGNSGNTWTVYNNDPTLLLNFSDNTSGGQPYSAASSYDINGIWFYGQHFKHSSNIDFNTFSVYGKTSSAVRPFGDLNAVLYNVTTDTNVFNVVVCRGLSSDCPTSDSWINVVQPGTLDANKLYRFYFLSPDSNSAARYQFRISQSSSDANMYYATFGGADNNRASTTNGGTSWNGQTSMDFSLKLELTSSTPDVNIVQPNGSQYVRGTFSVDFNVSDIDTNAVRQLFDINYSTTSAQGSGTVIVNDGNVATNGNLNCDSNNLGSVTACHYSWNTIGVSDGNYFILVRVTDSSTAFDFNSSASSFYIDNTMPSTSWDGNSSWRNSDLNVHLTCSDGSGSGCSSTKYRLDTGSGNAVSYGVWTAYDTNILIRGDGNWALDFNSSDVAGNVGDVNTFYVLIDSVAPNTVADYNSGWQRVDANVLFSCSDANSGCQATAYRRDSDATNAASYGSWVVGNAADLNAFFISDGNWAVDFNSTDLARNIEDINTTYVLIDKTKASTRWDGNAGTWQRVDVNIHLTCSDAGSGCSSTRYRIDLGAWTAYDTNIFFNADGNYRLDFNSTDSAGNIGDTNTFWVAIDKNSPTVQITSPANGSSTTDTSITVTYVGNDGVGSGVARYYIKADSGQWINNSLLTTYTFGGQSVGSHTYYVRAEDSVDFNSSDASVSVTITSSAAPEAPSGGTGGLSCAAGGGKICSLLEKCSGSFYTTTDSSRCCNKECVLTAAPTCTGAQYLEDNTCKKKKTAGQKCSSAVECLFGKCFQEICGECIVDEDCLETQYCSNNLCLEVTGECGYVENHKWIAYECCSNADCGAGFACDLELHSCVAGEKPKLVIQLPSEPRENTPFTIRVVDEQGNPVEGVQVEVDGVPYKAIEGVVELSMPAGLYVVEASKPGFETDSQEIVVPRSVLIEAPESAQVGELVEIRVVDSKGNLLKNIELAVTFPNGNTAVIKTNEEGIAYVQSGIAGNVVVEVQGTGFTTASLSIEVKKEQGIGLELALALAFVAVAGAMAYFLFFRKTRQDR